MAEIKGILCVDKPQNITSFSCCSVFKRLLKTKKIGHGGTLDPMATGVLPLLIGRATKALDILPNDDKEYLATLKFGYDSNTGDIWGDCIGTYEPPHGEVIQYPELSDIEAELSRFRGEIMQIPPMVSALKKDGVRLYELARQGIEVERKPRKVIIHQLEITDYKKEIGELSFRCHCTAGTYIRTICTDLGDAFGLGAIMTQLRRTMSHGFTLDRAINFEQAKNLSYDELIDHIMPIQDAFNCYPSIIVSPAQAVRFSNGGELDAARIHQLEKVGFSDNLFRVLGKKDEAEDDFLGIGEIREGSLWVKKLL